MRSTKGSHDQLSPTLIVALHLHASTSAWGIRGMLEQVRNVVVIKISVVIPPMYYMSVALFILVQKNNFHMYKNSSTSSINATLWHYLGTYNLDFRHENNSTLGVLIKEIRY